MCVYTWGKGVWGDYKTHPQPELLVCFHGEVESALEKRLMAVMMGPFFPRGSFPWQWVNEFLVNRGGIRVLGG